MIKMAAVLKSAEFVLKDIKEHLPDKILTI